MSNLQVSAEAVQAASGTVPRLPSYAHGPVQYSTTVPSVRPDIQTIISTAEGNYSYVMHFLTGK